MCHYSPSNQTGQLGVAPEGKMKQQKENRMKHIKTMVIAAAFGAVACSTALAQGRPGGGPGQRPVDANPPLAMMVSSYALAAPFDKNKDGSLDATEQGELSQAVADGKVSLPAPPNGAPVNGQGGASRLAMVYSTLAAYDTNKDGTLDATEQTAVEQAIKDGKLRRPGGGRGGPGGRPGQQ